VSLRQFGREDDDGSGVVWQEAGSVMPIGQVRCTNVAPVTLW